MKSKLTVLLILCFAAALQAQAPEKMSYQAVIRNSSDDLVKNTQVGMRISILQGATGTVVYTETQTPTTNANGLLSIEFGGGTSFSAIDWSNGVYFLKTETDINGGTNYTLTGTSQLLSVPYALYAKTAGNVPPVNQPPTCSITAPANNAIVGSGNIQVIVEANDTDGSIADVQLFVDGFAYSSTITSPYIFTINSLTFGAHVLTALAKDDKGAATISAAVNIISCAETDASFCARMAGQGKTCGTITGTDACGKSRTVDCGTSACTPPYTQCNASNACVCPAESDASFCARMAGQGKTCGTITGTDTCGNSRTVNCGTSACTPPYTQCNASNACVCPAETDASFCTRMAGQGKTCGTITGTDTCGNSRTVDCGTSRCPEGTICNYSTNSCVNP